MLINSGGDLPSRKLITAVIMQSYKDLMLHTKSRHEAKTRDTQTLRNRAHAWWLEGSQLKYFCDMIYLDAGSLRKRALENRAGMCVGRLTRRDVLRFMGDGDEASTE